jgi:hypothetical protein
MCLKSFLYILYDNIMTCMCMCDVIFSYHYDATFLQMFNFGYDHGNFSEVVNRGHLTLRHLLLKDWDACKFDFILYVYVYC